MSRYYRMELAISGYDPDRVADIKAEAEAEWAFEDEWIERERHTVDDKTELVLESTGEDSLCAGEREEDFAYRLVRIIWAVNGKYCNVVVVATYLDNPPTSTFEFGEAEYEEMMTPGVEES